MNAFRCVEKRHYVSCSFSVIEFISSDTIMLLDLIQR